MESQYHINQPGFTDSSSSQQYNLNNINSQQYDFNTQPLYNQYGNGNIHASSHIDNGQQHDGSYARSSQQGKRGAEVFVAKIPREGVTEQELRSIFQKAGEVRELKVVIDKFTNTNKGFAFVVYATKEEARRAVQELNNYQIRERRYLVVLPSVNNNRLFIGNVPKEYTEQQFMSELSKTVEGVSKVSVYLDVNDPTKNKGYIFAEFDHYLGASNAKKKLQDPSFRLGGRLVQVDWAEPSYSEDDPVLAGVKVVYIRNVPPDVTYDQIAQKFGEAGEMEKVKRQEKYDYAFVYYRERPSALKAIELFNGALMGDRKLEVTLAVPQTAKKGFGQGTNVRDGARSMGGGGGPPGQGRLGGFGPGEGANYRTQMCTFFREGNCNKGSMCRFAHSEDELQYYRTAQASAAPFGAPPGRDSGSFGSGGRGRGGGRGGGLGTGGAKRWRDDGQQSFAKRYRDDGGYNASTGAGAGGYGQVAGAGGYDYSVAQVAPGAGANPLANAFSSNALNPLLAVFGAALSQAMGVQQQAAPTPSPYQMSLPAPIPVPLPSTGASSQQYVQPQAYNPTGQTYSAPQQQYPTNYGYPSYSAPGAQPY